MSEETYAVAGLTCTDCAERVRATVCQIDGVSYCEVDPGTGTMKISFITPSAPTESIAEAVRQEGYELVTRRATEERFARGFIRFLFGRTGTTLTVVAAGLTLVGLALTLFDVPSWSWITLLAAAIGLGGYPVARNAFRELWRSRNLGINSLMVIAVIGAGAIGEWGEAAVVVVLFSLGEALEGFAAEQARGALEGLLDLAPRTALRITGDGETEEVPVEDLAVGDRVLVRPGDRISVDGVVQSGRSAVDQSPITGESVPVEKISGDPVFAGTVNLSGALEVEATRRAEDNTLSHMVALVREAQSRHAPVQRFIDRFARVYTPTVTVIAALVAVVPPLALGRPFWGEAGWLVRALQMLVIACPCALVISTPVSLVSAMTNAASRGVLIKGGRYLEALSQAGVFAFDKTGTLTVGRPVVTDLVDVCSCEDCPDTCGLEHAAALEVQSSHPLAQALVEEARARGVAVPAAQNVAILSGRGIEGVVNGRQVTVGSHAHFDEHFPHDPAVCRRAEDLAAQGKTVVLVRHDDEICALFGVADAPRASSRRALDALKAEGVRTLMLTGDDPRVAEQIARQVGVDTLEAGLLPEEKVAAIAALTEAGERVVMVGDGVNDAPALARADVGVAMGAAGSAQAMETADVVLMGDDLEQLPFALRLSRRAKGVVTANIVFALVVKAIVFGLALAGLATLWMAIVADVGASLTVILNGMRLRRMEP
ncbi:MAG: cation-translocating P-type ATPase [Anaerolineae bacterium]|jgi:Cd2+/Zn2+-exporting ATPase